MADKTQVRMLKKSVHAWNRWRSKNPDEPIDLTQADLRQGQFPNANLKSAEMTGAQAHRANFERANFTSARMSDARFIHSTLAGATLFYADLPGANLESAELSSSDLRSANFARADLSGAKLGSARLHDTNFDSACLVNADFTFADFLRSDLRNVDLAGATFYLTRFAECDLSQVRGLEAARCLGPSTIGVDTIFRSRGDIPAQFLRGCGVPETLILQLPSMMGAESGLRFYTCFISYSSKDDEFARRLLEKMRAADLRVWFAPEDMKGGEKSHDQIERAICVHDKLLLVLSKYSLQSSWVTTEIRRARGEERRTGRRKLFPVRLVPLDLLKEWTCFDADHGEDLAAEVRSYHIADFTQWKDHDAFEANFMRLLTDLRAAR